jgi:hypothetical protein
LVLAVATLVACSSPNRSELCVDEANRRLQGQVYRLDTAALEQNETKNADGTLVFRGTVVLKPGTTKEETQSIECVVAPDADGAPVRVVGFRFDWHTGPASDETPSR